MQLYIDDIIFSFTNNLLCQEFCKAMQGEFEMSMMGELTFLDCKSNNVRMEPFLTKKMHN